MPELNKPLKSFLGFALVLSALAGASPVFGSTITVTNLSPSGPGSLSDAITNAASGDTITFSVTGIIPPSQTQIISKDLTIIGPGGNGIAINGILAGRLFNISQGATVTISGVTVEQGHAVDFAGAFKNSGTLTILDSTLSQNSGGCGGAIYNNGTLTVINSTFWANGTGPDVGDCLIGGGAISNWGPASISNSTFVGNAAVAQTVNGVIVLNGTYGGTIANWSQKGGILTLKGNIMIGNSAGLGNNCYSTDPIASQGYNLVEPSDGVGSGTDSNSCYASLNATDITNKTAATAGFDPRGLEKNGGPMFTIALFPGSPAVDAIPAASCTDANGNLLTTDERGFARPQGGGCDIGAYELVPAFAPLPNLGAVQAWGNNAQGELGNGTQTSTNAPVQVSGLSGVAAIAAGQGQSGANRFSLALKNDGTVWAWGSNALGSLGNGADLNTGPGPSTTPGQISSLGAAAAIAAGGGHGLTLLNNGTVWAWGNNSAGQLGDGTITTNSTPQEVSGPAGGIATGIGAVTAIAAGDSHSLAVLIDGTVWTWGDNSAGELGDGSTTSSSSPVQVGGLSGVTALAAGLKYSLALKSDGTVWAWGDNSVGELGIGSTTGSNTPVQVSSLSGVTAIAASNTHSLALRNDGTVWAWGDDTMGDLGNGSTTESNTPVQVTGLTGAKTIAAGQSFSMALKTDGTVWAWGGNGVGQLGNGSNTSSSTPVGVSGLSGARVIASGGLWGMAVASAVPAANPLTVSTNENTPLAITLAGSSATACELAFTILTGPANGTLGAIADSACAAGAPNTDTATVTYTPASSFSSADSFTYKVNDGIDSAPVTVSITVNAIQNQTITVTTPSQFPATAVYGSSIGVAATGGDSGNPVTISGSGSCTGGGNNSASITITAGNGNCAITFNQAGSDTWLAATTVTEIVAAQPAPITVTASSATVTYGNAVPAISAALSGFVNHENGSVLTAQPTCTTTYTPTSGAGSGQTTSCSGATAANYSFSYVGGTVTVNKATPQITWGAPAAMNFGGALGSGQLNASANVPGVFSYSPPAGTVLTPGNGQTLSATFTPTDLANYAAAAGSTVVNVNPAQLSPAKANLVVTTVLTRSAGNIVVVITVANPGGTTADNVTLTSAKVASTAGTPVPQNLGSIAPGTIVQATVTVPGTAGSPGAASTLSTTGTYTGGTFSYSGRIALP